MGLYKRNSTWCIQYFAHGDRVREAIGPSKRQATLVLAKRQADIREGRYFETQKERPLTFPLLADRYVEEYAKVFKKPRSSQRNVVSMKALKEFFGNKSIQDLTPEDVDRYSQERKAQGRANATINADIALLSHAYTWANKRKLTRNHPVRGRGKLKAAQKDRYLEHEEIQRLLNNCTGDLHDIVVFALGTGMRVSEILGLQREQINLKQSVALLQDTKNGDCRPVPLPSQVIQMLSCRPTPLHEFFPGWNLMRVEHEFPKAVQRANLVDVTFHTLRHTFASHAVMAGTDLLTLSRILGHKNISQTQRYAHLAPGHLAAATTRTADAIFAVDMPRPVPHASQQVA